MREVIAHDADALAAARCACGAEGSLGQRPNVPGTRVITKRRQKYA